LPHLYEENKYVLTYPLPSLGPEFSHTLFSPCLSCPVPNFSAASKASERCFSSSHAGSKARELSTSSGTAETVPLGQQTVLLQLNLGPLNAGNQHHALPARLTHPPARLVFTHL
jgi:hypothetical protein